MAQTTPPSMTPAPSPAPQRNDRATFSGRVDAFVTWLAAAISEFSALATNVYNNAVDAYNSATSAATQAGNALTQANNAAASATSAAVTANAAAWNAGTAYALNVCAISQVDFRTYRRKVAGTTATDPANDTTNWVAVIPAAGGLGGATITTSTTLTAASAGDMLFNPSAPGMVITMPNATTCGKGAVLFAGFNISEFDVKFVDSAGKNLGFCRGMTGMSIGLADNATSAGVWAPTGLQRFGTTATFANTSLSTSFNTTHENAKAVTIDADRTLILIVNGGTLSGIVYNKTTQTWGAITSLATSLGQNVFGAILTQTAGQVLLVYGGASGAINARTVSISGTTITPNTQATTGALTGNVQQQGIGALVYVSAQSSYVANFGTDAGLKVVAFSISGTTVTIGTPNVTNTGSSFNCGDIYVVGSVARVVAYIGSSAMVIPYTVAGVALTIGTQGSMPAVAGTGAMRSILMGNGDIALMSGDVADSFMQVGISRLIGTTETLQYADVGATSATNVWAATDMIALSNTKVLLVWRNGSAINLNIVTVTNSGNVAPTFSTGTMLTYSLNASPSVVAILNLIGSVAKVLASSLGANGGVEIINVDCSAASPVQVSSQGIRSGGNSIVSMSLQPSDRFGRARAQYLRNALGGVYFVNSFAEVPLAVQGNSNIYHDFRQTDGYSPVSSMWIQGAAGEAYMLSQTVSASTGLSIRKLEIAA